MRKPKRERERYGVCVTGVCVVCARACVFIKEEEEEEAEAEKKKPAD